MLVVLLVELVACLAVSKFDSLEGAHSLQMLERAEDRRRVGRNTALSKGLVYLVKGPPVPITFGKERGYGISDVARTRHTRIIHFFTSDLQNLRVYGRPSDAVSKTIVSAARSQNPRSARIRSSTSDRLLSDDVTMAVSPRVQPLEKGRGRSAR
jgi:hypothetical protein